MTKRRIAAALAALLTLTACGQPTPGTPRAAGAVSSESDCATVDVPLLELDTHSATEPRVRIPQPPGWERYTDMDSELIRAAVVNKSLTADGFTPNVVYTLDKLPADIDPQDALDKEREGLVKMAGATDLEVTAATVCGLPGETVHYTLSMPASVGPHPVILRQAVVGADDHTYVVCLTIQTTNPTDATYQRDSMTILDGLQVLSANDG